MQHLVRARVLDMLVTCDRMLQHGGASQGGRLKASGQPGLEALRGNLDGNER